MALTVLHACSCKLVCLHGTITGLEQCGLDNRSLLVSWRELDDMHFVAACRHMLTVASSGTGMIKASIMTLGTPGLHSVRRVLMQAMLNPLEKHPGRPRELFVAHR